MNVLGVAFFILAALAALVGALLTVLAKNPIRSAMALLLSIGGITGLFLALHAQFLAAIELIVYAGAVVILFVFVIMLIGPDAAPDTDSRAVFSRGIAAVIFSVGAAITAFFLMKTSGGAHPFAEPRPELGSIDAFGRELFTRGLVPFELATALFVVAVVGAIAIARGKTKAPLEAAETKGEAS
jgi:NADH-quinone oxidoreductase subunit J